MIFRKIKILIFLIGFVTFAFSQSHISQKESIYTLSIADLTMSIDAKNGGKIISFQRAGKEILLQRSVHPFYYGATLWVSPQNENWPQSAILDRGAYSAQIINDTLRLISEKDSLAGFQFIKSFYCLRDKSIEINYTIRNISEKTKKIAAWEVTRVPSQGEFKIPYDELLENSLENIKTKGNVLYYSHKTDTLAPKQKLYATVRKGWIRYKSNGLLFIKEFPATKKEDLPPLQGTVEIFIAPKSQYIEMENHGKYTELKPGEKLNYSQKWKLSTKK